MLQSNLLLYAIIATIVVGGNTHSEGDFSLFYLLVSHEEVVQVSVDTNHLHTETSTRRRRSTASGLPNLPPPVASPVPTPIPSPIPTPTPTSTPTPLPPQTPVPTPTFTPTPTPTVTPEPTPTLDPDPIPTPTPEPTTPPFDPSITGTYTITLDGYFKYEGDTLFVPPGGGFLTFLYPGDSFRMANNNVQELWLQSENRHRLPLYIPPVSINITQTEMVHFGEMVIRRMTPGLIKVDICQDFFTLSEGDILVSGRIARNIRINGGAMDFSELSGTVGGFTIDVLGGNYYHWVVVTNPGPFGPFNRWEPH